MQNRGQVFNVQSRAPCVEEPAKLNNEILLIRVALFLFRSGVGVTVRTSSFLSFGSDFGHDLKIDLQTKNKRTLNTIHSDVSFLLIDEQRHIFVLTLFKMFSNLTHSKTVLL